MLIGNVEVPCVHDTIGDEEAWQIKLECLDAWKGQMQEEGILARIETIDDQPRVDLPTMDSSDSFSDSIRFVGINHPGPYHHEQISTSPLRSLEQLVKLYGNPREIYLGTTHRFDPGWELDFLCGIVSRVTSDMYKIKENTGNRVTLRRKYDLFKPVPEINKLINFLYTELDIPENHCISIAGTILEPRNLKKCLVESANLVLFYSTVDGSQVKLKVSSDFNKSLIGAKAAYIMPDFDNDLEFVPKGLDEFPVFHENLWLFREQDVSGFKPKERINRLYWARMFARLNYLGKLAFEKHGIKTPPAVTKDSYQIMEETAPVRQDVNTQAIRDHRNLFDEGIFYFRHHNALLMNDFKPEHALWNGYLVDMDYLCTGPPSIMLAGLCIDLNRAQKERVVNAYLKEASKYTGVTYSRNDKNNLIYDIDHSGRWYFLVRELGGLGKAVLARPQQNLRPRILKLNQYLVRTIQ